MSPCKQNLWFSRNGLVLYLHFQRSCELAKLKYSWSVVICLYRYELLWHYGKLQEIGEEAMEQKAFFLMSSRCFHLKLKVTNKSLDKPLESLAPVSWKKSIFPEGKKKWSVQNNIHFLFVFIKHLIPAGPTLWKTAHIQLLESKKVSYGILGWWKRNHYHFWWQTKLLLRNIT